MDTEKLSWGVCPVGRGLARAGDAWSMLILRDAGLGQTRFDDFQKGLGIAPNILTKRLAALVEAGLLERRRYNDRPPRDEYVLTEAGRDYLPVLQALGGWARKHFGEGAMKGQMLVKPVTIIRAQRLDGTPKPTGRAKVWELFAGMK